MQEPTKNLAETLAAVLPTAQLIYPPAPVPGDILRLAVPGNFKLHDIDTEPLLDNPRRTVLAPSFADAASFVAYIKRHLSPAAVVWVNFNPQTFSLGFKAVLDDAQLGLPGWRKHTASYNPELSHEWKAWKGKDEVAMEQLPFAEWIEEHANDIATDGNDGMPSSLQMLEMATNFVHNEERALKSTVKIQGGGVRMTYVADADKGTEAEMKLFEKFQLGMPVFHGGAAFYLQSRLKYRKSGSAVKFHYELIRADRVYQHAAQALIASVTDGLADAGVPIFMGACS